MIEKIRLNRFDLGPKLILAFVLVALLVAVTGFVGYHGVTTVDEESHLIAEDGLKMDHSVEMIVAIEQQRAAVQSAQLGEPGAQEEFTQAGERFSEASQRLEDTHLSPEQEEQLSRIQARHEEFSTLGAEFFEARQAGNTELAAQKAEAMDVRRTEIESEAHALEQSAQADHEAQLAIADRTARNTQLEIAGLTLLSLVAAVAIGLFVTRRITTPIDQLSECAADLREGTLDTNLDDHVEDDEIGRMVESFKGMQQTTQEVFADLEDISRNLRLGDLDHEVTVDHPGAYGDVMQRLDEGIEQLSQGFAQISLASEGLSRGDLDQPFDTDLPGQYGTVLEDLEHGIAELSGSIDTVQSITAEVATSSEEVTASVEEIEMASQEVAGSVEEISQGANEQSENLQQVSDEMSQMSATVEEIAASAQEVAATATTAVEQGDEGREYASEATDEIRAIESRAHDAAAQVQTLNEQMEEIGDIVEIITDIADQTNLLALNASVEAARVGDEGHGFAVVADEIKDLAEEAAKETTDIENRIEDAQSATAETVDGIHQMTDRIESGSEIIDEAIVMFDEIADTIDDAEGGIREISEATDDQAVSAEEVVAIVSEVASGSEQAAAEASNVSAATEEQTASLSEASENIQSVTQLADDLHEQVSKFEVRTTATGAPSPTATPASDRASAMPDGGERTDGRGEHPGA